MRAHLLTLLFCGLACGAPQESTNAEAPVAAEAETSPTPEPEPVAAEPMEAAEVEEVPAVGGECTAATQCTVVSDSCGRPYGTPLANPIVPVAPALCPPASYAVTEPACEDGVCTAITARWSDIRQCESAGDCRVIEFNCAGFTAVRRDEAREGQRRADEATGTRSCVAARTGPAPTVGCVDRVCVPR